MTAPLSYRDPKYYRDSGRIAPIRLLLAIAASLGFIAAAGWAYAYCDLYSGSMGHFKAVLPFIYGISCGTALGLIIHRAHVRNRSLSILLLLMLSVIALYVTWCFWIVDVFRTAPNPPAVSPLTFILRPHVTWRWIKLFNHFGVWSFSGSRALEGPIRGSELWTYWIAEAAIILICCIPIAIVMAGRLPYCESCRCWTKKGSRLLTLPLTDVEQLRTELEADDFAPMVSMSPARARDVRWLEVWTHSCKHCEEFNTLTVKQAPDITKRRPTSFFRRPPGIDRLLLSNVDLQALKAVVAQHRRDRANAKIAMPAPEVADTGETADQEAAND